MADGDAAMEQQLRASGIDQQFRRGMNELFTLYLPPAKSEAGKSWKKSRSINAPGVGSVQMELTFEPAGQTKIGERTLELATFKGTAQAKGANLKVESIGGSVLFDNAAGRLATMSLNVKMSVTEAGQTAKVEVSQHIQVMDQLPKQ
jgi:hypothetical protein